MATYSLALFLLSFLLALLNDLAALRDELLFVEQMALHVGKELGLSRIDALDRLGRNESDGLLQTLREHGQLATNVSRLEGVAAKVDGLVLEVDLGLDQALLEHGDRELDDIALGNEAREALELTQRERLVDLGDLLQHSREGELLDRLDVLHEALLRRDELELGHDDSGELQRVELVLEREKELGHLGEHTGDEASRALQCNKKSNE